MRWHLCRGSSIEREDWDSPLSCGFPFQQCYFTKMSLLKVMIERWSEWCLNSASVVLSSVLLLPQWWERQKILKKKNSIERRVSSKGVGKKWERGRQKERGGAVQVLGEPIYHMGHPFSSIPSAKTSLCEPSPNLENIFFLSWGRSLIFLKMTLYLGCCEDKTRVR